MSLQSKEGQELKNKTLGHYKGQFLNTQKVPCMLFCCYKSFKMVIEL
jgi:hypothetical protein